MGTLNGLINLVPAASMKQNCHHFIKAVIFYFFKYVSLDNAQYSGLKFLQSLFFQEIVNNFLSVYNKRLDEEQLDKLLAKEGSSNPLWLSVACEELRVFGRFEELIEKIESLPNELIRYVVFS